MPTWEEVSPFTERLDGRHITATRVLIILNVLGGVLYGLLIGLFNLPEIASALLLHADQAVGKLRIWQFFTYGFIHIEASGLGGPSLLDLFMFVFVMYMLYQSGSMIEAHVGPVKLAVIYVASEVLGGLLHVVVQVIAGGTAASGFLAPGTFALFMYAGFLWPGLSIRFFFLVPMTARTAALLVYGIYVFLSLVKLKQGIAPWAVTGAMTSAYLMLKLEPAVDHFLHRWEFRAVRRKQGRERVFRERVDQILEKISREGMANLTWEERRVLKQASQESKERSQ